MSLSSAIYTSVSGLNTTSFGMSVIGNNVANTNTIGFKGSRTLFSDVLASLGEDASRQVGRGVRPNEVRTMFTQGAFQPTNNPLDFAIDGDGFFMVREFDAVTGAAGNLFYTRAGQFGFDRRLYLVNPDGLRLQAYQADSAGNITQTLGDIQMQPLNAEGLPVMNARPTSAAEIQLNLNADPNEPIFASGTLLDPLNTTKGPAANTYNYSAAMSVYDSAGNAHPVEIYFKKTSITPDVGAAWDAHIIWNAGKTIVDYREQIISLAFDTSGNLTSPTAPASVTLTWDPAWNAATSQPVTIDFTGSAQYGSPYSTVFQKVDGYPEGGLVSFRLAQSGILYGKYSNGQDKAVAQLALAKFGAPTELTKRGDNLFAESSFSGQQTIAAAGTGGAGNVFANSLEMSNIDLAEEFITMIMMQRAFQANGMVMSTAKEMLDKLINI